MPVLLGERHGSMGIKIGAHIGSGRTFLPGQMFLFGIATFIADSTGGLGQVETFAPGRIVRFGNLEYSADSCGEQILQGLASSRILEQLGWGFLDSIWEMPEEAEFFDPPTTHLITNVEDLTEVLEGATEEAEDTEEEVGE